MRCSICHKKIKRKEARVVILKVRKLLIFKRFLYKTIKSYHLKCYDEKIKIGMM